MQDKYLYTWPNYELTESNGWKKSGCSGMLEFAMPELETKLRNDSRWPGFFPSAICFVTTTDGQVSALEKVVGASIVNRFPYIVALSFCTKPLSDRHYVRDRFINKLESGKSVAIQYFEPGVILDRVMNSIIESRDESIDKRIQSTGLRTRKAHTNDCDVFEDAYMVYEARLVQPGRDFEAIPIFDKPYTDYGSHRIYYLEIQAIQLRKDIACSKNQILWKSLPLWNPLRKLQTHKNYDSKPLIDVKYQKGYTSEYYFPAKNTVGFKYDKIQGQMAIRLLPPLPEDQVEIDNDNARWPCFFPSSVGMITTYDEKGIANLMPCGSTSVLIRHPLCIAVCVSYAKINARYAPRASLNNLITNNKFVCGVPFADEQIIDAIKYAGNVSIVQDANKINHSGLVYLEDDFAPVIPAFPISFKCKIVDTVRLGTHFLFLGQVESILVRDDVTLENPLKWYSYPNITYSKD